MRNDQAVAQLSAALKRNDYPIDYLSELMLFLGIDIDRKELTTKQQSLLQHVLFSLSQQVPVEYLVGSALFYNRRFFVTRNVLIPRPDTEQLVEKSLEIIHNCPDEKFTIIDIGTGSGAIIITLALELKNKNHTYYGIDISKEALAAAEKNAEILKMQKAITFKVADTFPKDEKSSPLIPDTDHVLLVSNPPYITNEEMETLPTSVREYEPDIALRRSSDFVSKLNSYANALIAKGKAVHCAFEYSKNGQAVFYSTTELKKDGLQALFSQ